MMSRYREVLRCMLWVENWKGEQTGTEGKKYDGRGRQLGKHKPGLVMRI